MRYHPVRLAMFEIMHGAPEAEWTARALTDRLTDLAGSRSGVVGDTLRVLMHERMAEPVPYQRSLTVRLTAAGHKAVGQFVAKWRLESEAEGARDESPADR